MTQKLTYHPNYNLETRTYFYTTFTARKVRKGDLWLCNEVLSEKVDYYAKKGRINMKKQIVVSAIPLHCDLNFQVLDSFVEMLANFLRCNQMNCAENQLHIQNSCLIFTAYTPLLSTKLSC